MSARRPDPSPIRALAMAVACFAVMLGALLPSAIVGRANAEGLSPVCGVAGVWARDTGTNKSLPGGFKCADCVFAAALAVAPPVARRLEPASFTVADGPSPPEGRLARLPARAPPRPPSTAPPLTA